MTAPVAAPAAEAPAPVAPGALEVSGLTRSFGGVTALDNLSFRAAVGECLAVIGPNGAGKTTLLRLVAGQDRPTAGTITLAGVGRVDGRSPHAQVRAGVALARQVPRPLSSLTVRDNVLVGTAAGRRRRGHGDHHHVQQVLELTGLAALADRVAGSLSLLDLKRLELARALASSPRLLLLDEVSAGLTEHELDEAIALLRAVHARGTTMLVVEHVQRVVRAVAQRVLVLDWGQLLAEGSPEEVAADPRVRAVYLGSGRAAAAPAATAPAAAAARPGGLELEQVTVLRGRLVALDRVSLHVGEGEIVAVLGANGAGKTTLTQAVSGLLPVRSGSIRWRGRDITAVPAHRRARLGIAHCQEGRKIFPGLTVRENLLLGAYGASGRERRRRLADVLDVVGVLADRQSQLATTLSGGQQQLLAIARALMSEPALIMLDEVSLGLSPKAGDEIYEHLGRVASLGVSLLLVEQDTDRALAAAARAYLLSHGRVVLHAPAAEIDRGVLASAYLGDPQDAAAPARPAG